MKYKINIKYLSVMYIGAINESLCAFLGEHFIFCLGWSVWSMSAVKNFMLMMMFANFCITFAHYPLGTQCQ